MNSKVQINHRGDKQAAVEVQSLVDHDHRINYLANISVHVVALVTGFAEPRDSLGPRIRIIDP